MSSISLSVSSLTISTRYDTALFLLRVTDASESEPKTKEQIELANSAFNATGRTFASYSFIPYGGVVLLGGDGSDHVVAGNSMVIAAGDGDDRITVLSDAVVDGGNGDDHIDASFNSILSGGAGNDHLYTHGDSIMDGGDGDDNIDTYDNAIIFGGRGNDTIYGMNHLIVDGGSGDDNISVADFADIDAGTGDDVVHAYTNAKVDAGAGDDVVLTSNTAHVLAGAGDDYVRVGGFSYVDGGTGNDVLVSDIGGTTLDGDAGDDYLQAGPGARLTGGAGNDTIRVMGSDTEVFFGRGDGSDVIRSNDAVTLNISGHSQADVTITEEGDAFLVTFAGSGDTLTLDLGSRGAVKFQFEDGSAHTVTGANVSKTFSQVVYGGSDPTTVKMTDTVYDARPVWPQVIPAPGASDPQGTSSGA